MRYWSISELCQTFGQLIGNTDITVDCYFGLGLQKSDMKYMSPGMKTVIAISEILRKISLFIPFMKYVADSVYVSSKKENFES